MKTPFERAVARAKRAIDKAEAGRATPDWPRLLAAAERAVARVRALR